jgi:hypothetical protein
MSLAMYASPIDNEENQTNNDNFIAKKRITSNNRTQKRIPKENNFSEKVNSVLQSIHSHDDTEQLGDFNPIPPPTSAGVEQTRLREQFSTGLNENTENTNLYDRFVPNYESMYKKSSNHSPTNLPYYLNQGQQQQQQQQDQYNDSNILIEKLNYMIKLLEEQQDEKTNNVTEEIVLYCFLGIFIIFIIDSFVRVGKYVR